MTPDERWLSALWPLVRAHLPAAPARVLEVGCGASGGFIPMLRSDGYRAIGVDPLAPRGPGYERIEFERYESLRAVDVVVACNSLHHVTDPGKIVDQIATALQDEGVLVVIEWARERFDEATANWCFDRLRHVEQPRWLHRRRDDWVASGQTWDAYLQAWGEEEGTHSAQQLLEVLSERFDCSWCRSGPRFFPELDATESEEQAAIDAGQIRATRIDYVARLR